MMLNVLAWLLFPFLSFASDTPLAHSPLDEELINRDHYSLSYNEKHEVANWVAYSLDHYKLQNCVQRKNSFRIDPLITTGSASPTDYINSNYDRGHLLPAGDMKFDKSAMRDTFVMSNMTPQPAKFNRGRWSNLETLIRAWALKYKKIWIVTGPVLTEKLPTIGNANRVSIPTDYYKAILREDNEGYKGIGFLMNVEVPFNETEAYAVSINKIEELSGVDFFPFLNDQVEEEIEDNRNFVDWDFKANFNYLPCSI